MKYSTSPRSQRYQPVAARRADLPPVGGEFAEQFNLRLFPHTVAQRDADMPMW